MRQLITSPTAAAATGGPWDELDRELDRSRRYGHNFTLARIPAASATSLRRVGRSFRKREHSAQDEVSSLLRQSDRSWSDGRSVYVLLPETDRSGAEVVFSRMRERTPHLVPDSAVEVATFPDSGMTSGALIAAVHGAPVLNDAPVPLQREPVVSNRDLVPAAGVLFPSQACDALASGRSAFAAAESATRY